MSENSELLGNAEAANYMNEYYTDAGPKLASTFSDNWSKDQSKIMCNKSFSFSIIAEGDINKLVKEIKISKLLRWDY